MVRVFVAFMALFISGQALAQQQQCGPSQMMIDGLKASYGEIPIWEGLLEAEGQKPLPVIMFASAGSRTWTLVSNPRPAVFCLMFKGSAFDLPALPRPVKPVL